MRYEMDFIGRVQGVGFRATAAALAREHAIVGWIRNEPDGSVKLAVEGKEADLDAYLADLRKQMADFISSEELEKKDEERGYTGFEIRY